MVGSKYRGPELGTYSDRGYQGFVLLVNILHWHIKDPNTILEHTMFSSGNQSITLSVAQPSLYVEKERKNVAHVTLSRAPVGPEY